jgi:hypothetical protein
MLQDGAEVAGVEVIGGTDLGRGQGRQMERGHNKKREYGLERHRGRVRSVPRAGARSTQTPRSERAMLTGAARAGSFPRAGGTGEVCSTGGTTEQERSQYIL